MRISTLLIVAAVSFFSTPCLSQSDDKAPVDTEATEAVDALDAAIADHFRVSKDQVALAREKKIPDEHLPVVFFIARQGKVSAEKIIALRVADKSWRKIGLKHGLNAETFHVQVMTTKRSVYEHALGHYKGKKRSLWRYINLSENDIVALVRLKFLSAHHHCSADDIIALHRKGDTLVELNARAQKMSDRNARRRGKKASRRRG